VPGTKKELRISKGGQMIITIIILAYVDNVFLNRWLSKIIYKNTNDAVLEWTWFIPILMTMVLLVEAAPYLISVKFKNWFIGKHWKKD
jgi:hypothetical protein